MKDTEVTFPAGEVVGTGVIQALVPLPDGSSIGVVVDTTPFHPVDHTWPDQPADAGTLAGIPVVDCVVAALSPDGQVLFGSAIPVRRGDDDWRWLVAHVLPADRATALSVADSVDLEVDADRRGRLSRGHSACHLAALALNQVTAPYWTKDVGRRDDRGFPDLDSIAITVSRIGPDSAYDEYKLGKSVRKRGLGSADLLADLPALADAANSLLAQWTSAGGRCRIDTGGDLRLTARRTWTAQLPEGPAAIPCGGTHVSDLAELGMVTVVYTPTEAGFAVETSVDVTRGQALGT
ncbi:MAG: hypothetical protein V9E98_12805 [Candidatus Nanopelagicales bacterium]